MIDYGLELQSWLMYLIFLLKSCLFERFGKVGLFERFGKVGLFCRFALVGRLCRFDFVCLVGAISSDLYHTPKVGGILIS